MAALGPRDFWRQQQRYADEIRNLRTLVELTRTPAGEVARSPAARPPAAADLAWRRDRIARVLERLWRLEEHIQRRWLAALREIDVADAGAPAALEGLRERVEVYADGFPYQWGVSSYTWASMLHEELAELATSLAELEAACRAYLAATDR
jgi:hypothetical protein